LDNVVSLDDYRENKDYKENNEVVADTEWMFKCRDCGGVSFYMFVSGVAICESCGHLMDNITVSRQLGEIVFEPDFDLEET